MIWEMQMRNAKKTFAIAAATWIIADLFPAGTGVQGELRSARILNLLGRSMIQSAKAGTSGTVNVKPHQNTLCKVKVVDIKGRPVAGADVAAYERFSHFAAAHVTTTILEKERTDSDGFTTLNLTFLKRRNVFVVARKKGLAYGMDSIGTHAGPLDQLSLTILLDEPSAIAGQVVDEIGKPIVGARVHGHFTYRPLGGVRGASTTAPADWFTATTDNQGRFCFDNVPPDGSADFLLTAPGYATFHTFMAEGTIRGHGYAAGQTDARIVMQRPSGIRGRVVDRAGNPIVGVELLARPNRKYGNYYCTGRTLSDRQGNFYLDALPPDTYSLQVIAPKEGMAEWVAIDTRVITRVGQVTDNVVVRAGKGGIIEASVVEAVTNKPIENAWVLVRKKARLGDSYCFYQELRTDRRGRVRIRAPLGESTIVMGHESTMSWFTYNVSVKRTPTPMRSYLDLGPTVSGTIRDKSGKPVADATVVITPSGECVTTTDNLGQFRVVWRKRSKKTFLYAYHASRNLAAKVRLQDGSRPVDIILKPAITLTGRVTGPKGEPIPIARVELIAKITNWRRRPVPEVVTDSQGRYEIRGVAPPGGGFQYWVDVVAAGYAPLKNNPVPAKLTPSTSVAMEPIVLKPLDMSVSGFVVDARGKRVPNKIVYVSGPRYGNGQTNKSIITDAEGRFCFDRIAKGPIRLSSGSASSREKGPVITDAGAENVQIVLGKEKVYWHPATLVGKPLADLKQYGLSSFIKNNFSKPGHKNRVLLCFWDMNQQPSRSCVRSLSNGKAVLARQGVRIALVHTGTRSTGPHRTWLRQSNITLPCGYTRADLEELKHNWAIQSLPWLILTDRKFVVTAEGFGLNELKDEIRESADTE